MGTKLQELRSGCFAAAMDDEPMFVLLARDVHASAHVRAWANEREQMVNDGRKPVSDMEKVSDARGCADRMDAWREANDGAWRKGLFARQAELAGTVAEGMAEEDRTHGSESAVND